MLELLLFLTRFATCVHYKECQKLERQTSNLFLQYLLAEASSHLSTVQKLLTVTPYYLNLNVTDGESSLQSD